MLHILTSDEILARSDFVPVAESLLHTLGPQGALHLRSRALGGRSYVALARRLGAASRASGAWLVVNGRVDVAITAEAYGVQLGRGALLATDVRRIAPGLRVGVSVHSAEEVGELGGLPDWLLIGQLYVSKSHSGVPGRGLPFLSHVVRTARVPVVAVGGITPEHVAPILRSGAAGIAVISGVWQSSDPRRAAIRYLWEYGDRSGRGSDDSDGEREHTSCSPGDDTG